jgi:hypothetical protein
MATVIGTRDLQKPHRDRRFRCISSEAATISRQTLPSNVAPCGHHQPRSPDRSTWLHLALRSHDQASPVSPAACPLCR